MSHSAPRRAGTTPNDGSGALQAAAPPPRAAPAPPLPPALLGSPPLEALRSPLAAALWPEDRDGVALEAGRADALKGSPMRSRSGCGSRACKQTTSVGK
jgi:hypothetical protein